MPRSIETEVRALLRAIAEEGTYEANTDCKNPVCQALGRLQRHVERPKTAAATNGHH